MKINDAQRMGVRAFEAGKGSAPAQNAEFCKAAFNREALKATNVLHLMDAYSYGWTLANLADGWEQWFPLDNPPPSVVALAKIMNED